jgi:hypothetical protein
MTDDVQILLQAPGQAPVEFRPRMRGTGGLALTAALTDLEALSSPRSSFTKGVTLTGPEVETAFRNAARADVVGSRDILGLRLPAKLLVDGIDALGGSGVLQVSAVNIGPGGRVDYDCDLTGGRYDWASRLAALTWPDIDLGTFTYDLGTVRDSWDRTGKAGPANGWDFIGATFFPVHYGIWREGPFHVSLTELRPHIYHKWLLTKALEHVGYTLQGDYAASDYFEKSVHLFTGATWGVSREFYNNHGRSYIGQDVTTRYDPDSPSTRYYRVATGFGSLDWMAETTYTAPETASYTVQFFIFQGMALGQTSCNPIWIAELNGVEVPAWSATYVQAGPGVVGLDITFTTCLSEGDTLRMKIKDDTCIDPLLGNWMDITPGDAFLDIQMSPSALNGYCQGGMLRLNRFLSQEVGVMDVIRALTHRDNLVWLTDAAARTVTPVRLQDFHTLTEAEDWTAVLDHGQEMALSSDASACFNYDLRYVNDSGSDFPVKAHNLAEKRQLYSRKAYLNPDDPCRDDSPNPLYAATWYINEAKSEYRLMSQTNNPAASPVFPAIWLSMAKAKPETYPPVVPYKTENIISYDFAPRCALYDGLKDASDLDWDGDVEWAFDDEQGGGPAFETLYPHAYMVDYWKGTEGIAYADTPIVTQSPRLSPLAVTVPCLETTAYGDVLPRTRNTHILECTVRLSAAAFAALDFSKPKYIRHEELGQSRWLLVEVADWNPATGKARAVLSRLPEQ